MCTWGLSPPREGHDKMTVPNLFINILTLKWGSCWFKVEIDPQIWVDNIVFKCYNYSMFSYDVSMMGEDRIRVVVLKDNDEMGVLYFERGKVGFSNKPISVGEWVVVDAVVGDLYDGRIDPKDIVRMCRDEIKQKFMI